MTPGEGTSQKEESMHVTTNALSGEAALSTTVISAPSARALATGVAVAAAVALPQASWRPS